MKMNNFFSGKLMNLDEVVKMRKEAESQNRKVVFTNGCFDIIHRGHVEYLSKARALGDFLIIGLNTDNSVKRIKETGRPVINENDRAAVLTAFEFVDAVCFFNEDTPEDMIKALKPDILVKGAEYRIDEIVGHEFVLSNGGEVIPVRMTPGLSTSSIIKKIKDLPD